MNRDDSRLEDWRLNPPDYPEAPEEPEVEPCPFCGNYPNVAWRGDLDFDVGCSNPDCFMSEIQLVHIDEWNKRSEK